ncbi:MAG TPA: SpoIIE family protein phosphatase [Acidobacteriaceae bacterium]|nr:SpoIIE family protein phosphatase [Acidobacteriaceae bacterium]
MRASRLISVCFLLSLFLGSFAPHAHAQTQITLGNASTPLNGPWKFRTGDDLAWAKPDFDDSGWATMDLTPPPGSYDPILGSSGYLLGWTARGYKGYSGYAWYRLRTNVQDGQTRLAIKLPDDVDDAYQVYVNGQRIGEFGRFTARGVTAYITQPRALLLPENFRGGPVTFAIRMWMGAFTPLVDPDAGGLHGPPVLGQASAIGGLLQLDWDVLDRSNYTSLFQFVILMLALLVAFGLFWLDRKEPAYLWLGLTCAVMLSIVVLNVVTTYTMWYGGNAYFLLNDAVLVPATIGLWVLFWAYWFRLGHMTRLHRMVWGLVVVLALTTAMLRAPLYGSLVPVHASVWLSPLALSLKLLLGILLVWVTVLGIRKNRAEGWLALPVVLLVIVSRYSEELLVLHVPTAVYPFGVGIGVNTVATILSLAIITVLLLRRFLRGQHEREQFRMEMEQARQVQQMLIPEALPVIPGLTLESEYRPTQRVGGDFFQILAHPSDGSVLIVVGDVAGHGLQAAMLVSLLVGAIRNQAEASFDPLSLLQSLNRRLLGRSQANATCLALRIAPDGSATLANAGHLPPYVNGKEMSMEGALPLGTAAGTEFAVMRFQLQPGDRLTFVSDGVVEATNEKRELFGFARTQGISNQPAATIAETAQNFGQEDDITVVSVVRAMATVAAV